MKLNKLIEQNIDTREEIENWLLHNAYTDYSFTSHLRKLDSYSIDAENNIIDGKIIRIKTDEKILPYQLRNFTTFRIKSDTLISCKNFPYNKIKKMHSEYFIENCDLLDFSDFPTHAKSINLQIHRNATCSISKIYNNNLITNELDVTYCTNKDLYDFAKWDKIHTKSATISSTGNIPFKNLPHLSSIEKYRLEHIDLSQGQNSFYSNNQLDTLNDLITYFRTDKKHPEEFIMDFLLALIDYGFEDIA